MIQTSDTAIKQGMMIMRNAIGWFYISTIMTLSLGSHIPNALAQERTGSAFVDGIIEIDRAMGHSKASQLLARDYYQKGFESQIQNTSNAIFSRISRIEDHLSKGQVGLAEMERATLDHAIERYRHLEMLSERYYRGDKAKLWRANLLRILVSPSSGGSKNWEYRIQRGHEKANSFPISEKTFGDLSKRSQIGKTPPTNDPASPVTEHVYEFRATWERSSVPSKVPMMPGQMSPDDPLHLVRTMF